MALEQLGVPPARSSKGTKGEPCWPEGVGSLTHCQGYRGAVVGLTQSVRSVGIDAEPHGVLPDGVLNAVSLPVERYEIGALPGGLHWDRILFCAKEANLQGVVSADPALARLRGRPHHLRRRRQRVSGSFVSRILIDPAARSGPPLHRLEGRWSVGGGLALTAIVL